MEYYVFVYIFIASVALECSILKYLNCLLRTKTFCWFGNLTDEFSCIILITMRQVNFHLYTRIWWTEKYQFPCACFVIILRDMYMHVCFAKKLVVYKINIILLAMYKYTMSLVIIKRVSRVMVSETFTNDFYNL